MSNLFNREKRALNKKLKAERMERILAAAHRVFLRFPYFEVSMDSIRKIADVPQGRAEMYFGTREDLFLRVLRIASRAWAEELEASLTDEEGDLDPGQIAELLTASVQLHPDFFRLRGLLPMVFEQRLEMDSIMTVSGGLGADIGRVADALSARCDAIDASAARRLLLLLQAYGSSLHEAAHQDTSMNRLFNDEESSGFHLDLQAELAALVDTLVARSIN
jgi:AcrR family transcriptional regulator